MTKYLDRTNAREKGLLWTCSSKGIQSIMGKGHCSRWGRQKTWEQEQVARWPVTLRVNSCLLNSVPLLTQDLSQGRYGHSGQVFPPSISSIKIICDRHALRSTSWVTATSGRFIVHTTHYRQYNLCRLHLSEDARSRLGFCPFFFRSRGWMSDILKMASSPAPGRSLPSCPQRCHLWGTFYKLCKIKSLTSFPPERPHRSIALPPSHTSVLQRQGRMWVQSTPPHHHHEIPGKMYEAAYKLHWTWPAMG